MKNNKGFSLVELIIVIAIMAILVGVMAPQLIKYIEKTKVSSDTQLADTVKNAVTTAMLDPTVIQADDYVMPTTAALGSLGGGSTFQSAVKETLGTPLGDVKEKLKSKGARDVKVYIVSDNAVHVEITGSHADGKNGDSIYVD